MEAQPRCHECGRTPLEGHTYTCVEGWPRMAKPYVTQTQMDAFEAWLDEPGNRRRWETALDEARDQLLSEATDALPPTPTKTGGSE